MNEINGYTLQKRWFSFVKENSDLIKPQHGALFFWIIEKNNRLNWVEIFGFPTIEAMKMIGVKDRRTFRKALSDLENWGFVLIKSKSVNQNIANKIALASDAQAKSMKCISESLKTAYALASDVPINKQKEKNKPSLNKMHNYNPFEDKVIEESKKEREIPNPLTPEDQKIEDDLKWFKECTGYDYLNKSENKK